MQVTTWSRRPTTPHSEAPLLSPLRVGWARYKMTEAHLYHAVHIRPGRCAWVDLIAGDQREKKSPCMAIEFLCVTKHGAVIEADRHSETPTGSASFKCQTGVSPTAQVFQVRRLPEHANIARCKHPCSSWRGKKPMGVWSWGLSPP